MRTLSRDFSSEVVSGSSSLKQDQYGTDSVLSTVPGCSKISVNM